MFASGNSIRYDERLAQAEVRADEVIQPSQLSIRHLQLSTNLLVINCFAIVAVKRDLLANPSRLIVTFARLNGSYVEEFIGRPAAMIDLLICSTGVLRWLLYDPASGGRLVD